jgi:hypothetical protein
MQVQFTFKFFFFLMWNNLFFFLFEEIYYSKDWLVIVQKKLTNQIQGY